MNTILHLLGVALAGGLGTLARYGVSLGATALWGPAYPWGTFIANMLGCFLFGTVSGLVAGGIIPPPWKIYLLTGFLGGFTTFSAFAFENQQFLSSGRWELFAFHLLGQNALGILAILFGLYLSTLVLPNP